MAAGKVVETKRVYKVTLKIDGSSTATIYRPGMPFFIDTVEKCVAWLAGNEFEEEDIELIGSSPECWEKYYPKELPTLEETIAVAAATPSTETEVVV